MFTLPGLEERKQILKIFLKDDDLDPFVSIDAIAQHTEGLSGSDLGSVCGQAALDFTIESMKSNKKNGELIKLQLGNGHIVRALQKVQPSVTARSHKSIDEFNHQFNVWIARSNFSRSVLDYEIMVILIFLSTVVIHMLHDCNTQFPGQQCSLHRHYELFVS